MAISEWSGTLHLAQTNYTLTRMDTNPYQPLTITNLLCIDMCKRSEICLVNKTRIETYFLDECGAIIVSDTSNFSL